MVYIGKKKSFLNLGHIEMKKTSMLDSSQNSLSDHFATQPLLKKSKI